MNGRSKKKPAAAHSSLVTSTAGERPEAEGSRPLKSESPAAGLNERWLVPGVCVFLAAITFAVFGQTLRHEFVNYDDDRYVYENPVVQKGLTWEGFRWALTYGNIGHWHPLTWLSHMLDCQLYGLNPGGHHLTNVLLHTATAILLFLVLRRMTGFLWRSAFVAAVFAIHPLRVESVAWVAERKDVLSAFFFMLTLWAYTRYTQGVTGGEWRVASGPPSQGFRLRPASARQAGAAGGGLASPVTGHGSLFYWLVVLFFALGLLSKNMLVTMPFVLLLLDYWPLKRISDLKSVSQLSTFNHLLFEKWPFFLLSAASCVVTALVPEKVTAGQLPFGLRMENAVVSYVTYLWQMIHPSGLACLYPNPVNYLPLWQVAGAVGLLLAISGATWACRQTHPCLVVGWLWYLGMMIPVIGLVQISFYAHADRYTYLPQIGLYLLLTWAAADLCAGWRHRRVLLGGGATVILAGLIFCARAQTAYWRNSESLWTHTLACTSGNFVGHTNLGNALFKEDKVDEAIVQHQQALQINPDFAEAHNNLGNALLQKGRVDEAITHFQMALQIKPDNAKAHNNLGNALLQKGRVDEAMAHFQKALQINPDFAEAQYNFSNALMQKGKVDEAIIHFQKALQISPDNAKAHNNLGSALLQKGRADEAIAHFQKAVQIKPDYAGACYNLGNALLQKGRVDEAMAHFQKALQINPDFAEAHYTLGNALLLKGRADEAMAHYQKAVQIKPDFAEAQYNFGNALFQKGKVDEAMVHFQKAVQIRPDFAEGHYNLGNALLQKGRVDEAIAQYQTALQIKPDSLNVLNKLAWLLATCPDAHIRDGVQAVKYAGRACELTHYGVTILVGTLAAAYAEAGRFDDAMTTAQKACALASAAGEPDLLDKNQKLLALYRAHQPYREMPGKFVPAAP
jgi:tetratricopeptide (TPR) repeat protein